METLKELFNLKHWWKFLSVAGVLIAAAGIGRSVPGSLVGLGLLLFGVGMWANHPSKGQKQTVEGLLGFRVVDVPTWEPNALGIALCVAGVLLFGFGLVRLVLVP
jgi:hypothetical protein